MRPGTRQAPELDDFSIFFFKVFWETLKEDLLALFQDFHTNCARLDRINANRAYTEKPRSDNHCALLLNCVFKIVSKVLANSYLLTDCRL